MIKLRDQHDHAHFDACIGDLQDHAEAFGDTGKRGFHVGHAERRRREKQDAHEEMARLQIIELMTFQNVAA